MTRFETLQGWTQEHFQTLVQVAVAGGFALTAAELVLMHHTDGKQLIGVAATGLGAVVALAGIWARGRARGVVATAFAVLVLSGLFGTVMHLKGEDEDKEGFRWRQNATAWISQQGAAFAEEERDEEHEREGGRKGREGGEDREGGEGHEGGEGDEEHGPPPLAPLSISGLAFLGAVAVLAKKE